MTPWKTTLSHKTLLEVSGKTRKGVEYYAQQNLFQENILPIE